MLAVDFSLANEVVTDESPIVKARTRRRARAKSELFPFWYSELACFRIDDGFEYFKASFFLLTHSCLFDSSVSVGGFAHISDFNLKIIIKYNKSIQI